MKGKKRRRSKPTPKKLAEFLDALAETGNVLASAELTNLNRRELYRLRANDPAFAGSWDEALSQAADALEAEARRRALDGWEEPVFYQGVESGYVRKYSDTLLIFLLKGLRPDRFRDRSTTELVGAGGSPLVTAINVYVPSNGRDEGEADG